MQKFIAAAQKYLSQNINIIATDNSKRALFQWKEYQNRLITMDEITRQFAHQKAAGLAVVCGGVSGNLEVIDVDSKNDVTGKLFDNIISNINDSLLDKLLMIKTRSGGYHLYYRCEKIAGNQKLAMRAATKDELVESPHLKQVVLIETRGEAGYVIAPPSEGYAAMQKRSVATITVNERDTLLEICRSFSELVEEKQIIPKERGGYGKKPWDDYNEKCDVVQLLNSYGWETVRQSGERTYLRRPGKKDDGISGDYHAGLNLFKAFTTSSEFEPGKGYRPFGVYCLLEHNGDASQAAKHLISLGYGEKSTPIEARLRTPIRKLRDAGYSDEQIVDKLQRDHKLSHADASDTLKNYDIQSGNTISTFWDVDEKGKITIGLYKLRLFLTRQGGFGKYFYDPASTIFKMVRECDGFVEETSIERIKEFIKEYINTLEPIEPFDHGVTAGALHEIITKGADVYFGNGKMEMIDQKHFDFLKDTHDTAFLPFNNGVVCISKKGIEVRSYGDIKKVIWKREVINFNITIDPSFDPALCEFYRFIELIAGKDEKRVNYCLSLIGYLLHKYKDSARPWSVIFAEETDDEQKGGGTGKGILVKAIGYMVNTERVDGKNFKLDKNFAFQRVGLDTRIVAIEDVRRNVDFEGFYSIITEGMTVEKKNKDELFIPYSDSPKVIFTTNYTISSVGVHAKRRQRVFEFAPYFNARFTPVDEFRHKLFDDWDEDEWNRFYNLMFYCVSKYLRDGVEDITESAQYKRKHIKVNFGEEFLEYFESLIENGGGDWMPFTDRYASFLKQNDYDKKDYSPKRFKRAIIDSCEKMGLEIEDRRNRQNANQREFRITGANEVEKVENFEF